MKIKPLFALLLSGFLAAPAGAEITPAVAEADPSALDHLFDNRASHPALTVSGGRFPMARGGGTSSPYGSVVASGIGAEPAAGLGGLSPTAGEGPAAPEPSIPSVPSANPLPATYEEFLNAQTGPGVLWEKILWALRLPVRVVQIAHAEIIARGDGSLEEYSARLEEQVQKALSGVSPSFSDPALLKSFEEILGIKFAPGNRVLPLTDGPESFAKRFELIENAKQSINLMMWAIYDDETGFLTAQKLIEKAREGVKVRIIVDGQVAHYQKGKHKLLEYLEAAGIPVVRWHNPDSSHPYDGQHRKILVVDSASAIAGGMNIGDHYSHMGKSQKWRDQDVLVEGPAAAESERLFAREWNAQIARIEAQSSATEIAEMRQKGYLSLEEPADPAFAGDSLVAVINHVPRENDNGLKSILLSIETAKKSIDIENGYFIMTPALLRALERARERGVRIRVLMNSQESLDVPALLSPMLESASAVKDKGAEIYLRKGSTLHAKFMVVDDYAWVGSYNFQPRSDRMEREVLYGVLDPAFAERMRRIFEADIAAALKLEGPIEIPFSILSAIINVLFFYQL